MKASTQSLSEVSGAHASEADLVLPDLGSVRFLGTDGWTLLLVLGVVVCGIGLAFVPGQPDAGPSDGDAGS